MPPGRPFFSPRAGVTAVPRNGEVGHPLSFLPLSFDSFVRISSDLPIRVRVRVWDGHCFLFPRFEIGSLSFLFPELSRVRVRFSSSEPSSFLRSEGIEVRVQPNPMSAEAPNDRPLSVRVSVSLS